MRVSRQWQNLQAMKQAGLAHDPDRTRTPGDLALFCATCPQPGINLPLHEAEQAQNKYVTLHARIDRTSSYLQTFRSLYVRSVVVDGNFKLDNLKMKNAEEDVTLSDGEAFFVGQVQYQEHLKTVIQTKEVCQYKNNRELLILTCFRDPNAQIIMHCHKPMQGTKNT